MTDLEYEFTYLAVCQEFPQFNVWAMGDYTFIITGVNPSPKVQDALMRLHKVFMWAKYDEGFLTKIPLIEFKPKGFT